MLDDCKEHARAEKDLLDVLWNYCLMEKAAECVLFVSKFCGDEFTCSSPFPRHQSS